MIINHLLLSFLILFSLGKYTEVSGLSPCLQDQSNSVRLNNEGNVFSSTSEAGRVEICHCFNTSSCYWNTVSTGSVADPFSWKNSIVVCRELEFFDVQSPILQNTVPSTELSSSSVPIFQTTFNCDGSESSLHECPSGQSTTGLTHASDAYLMCQSSVTVNKVRLTGTATNNAGIVEVYYSSLSRWVTICPTSWTLTEANILCISLGFKSGTSATYNTATLNGPEISSTPDISVSCLGSSLFSQCTFSQISSCNNGNGANLAGASCTSETDISDGSVQLSTTVTSSLSFNRVEVFYNGRWGTVCDKHWDTGDGQVACRELGDRFDSVPSSSQIFNSLSSRPIYVLTYNCAGDESDLSSCRATMYPVGFVETDCSHINDAGLMCEQSNSDDGGGSSIGSSIAGSSFFIFFSVFVLIFLCVFFKDSPPIEKLRDCLGSCFDSISSCCERVSDCWDTIRECDCDCTCISCPTHRRHGNRNQHNSPVAPPLELVTTQPTRWSPTSSSSSSSSSSDSSGSSGITGNKGFSSTASGKAGDEDQGFTEKAPPTYNDALRLNHVKPPPDYQPPPPEEKKDLPYPVMSNFDPAHPPALPPTIDSQGQV